MASDAKTIHIFQQLFSIKILTKVCTNMQQKKKMKKFDQEKICLRLAEFGK